MAMRRRPVAVYRVIDEEELLGSEGIELAGAGDELTPSHELATDDLRDRVPRRTGVRAWSGWGSTTLGVVTLVGVAALLLSVSSRVVAPVTTPAASSPLRPVAPLGHVVPVVAPARRQSRMRRTPGSLPRRPRGVAAPRAPRLRTPPMQRATARARAFGAAPLSWARGPAATPVHRAPGQEFGFER
jgi:hypothetical protein